MSTRRPQTRLNWQDPELLEQLTEFAENGLTQTQIAHCLRVAPSTLAKNAQAYPDVAEAIAQGRSIGIHRVANKLFDDAIAGNTRAQMFYLKAVAGWREKEEVQASVSDKADAAFAVVEAEELAKLKRRKEEGQRALAELQALSQPQSEAVN